MFLVKVITASIANAFSNWKLAEDFIDFPRGFL